MTAARSLKHLDACAAPAALGRRRAAVALLENAAAPAPQHLDKFDNKASSLSRAWMACGAAPSLPASSAQSSQAAARASAADPVAVSARYLTATASAPPSIATTLDLGSSRTAAAKADRTRPALASSTNSTEVVRASTSTAAASSRSKPPVSIWSMAPASCKRFGAEPP